MFDILFETLPDSHKQVLSTQYRMIRNIGNLISTVFMEEQLIQGARTKINFMDYQDTKVIL